MSLGKCDKCGKELKRRSWEQFYVIREGNKIKKRLCCDREIFQQGISCYEKYIQSSDHAVIDRVHNFWACYKCGKSGKLPPREWLGPCPKCHYKNIWFSFVDSQGGELVVRCDDSGNPPSQLGNKLGSGWIWFLVIMAIIILGGIAYWWYNSSKENKEQNE